MDAEYEPMEGDGSPIYGDFLNYIGEFYNMGEYGVIYSTKWWPDRLVKVVNCDITDGESNMEQTDFYEKFWDKGIRGLPTITSFCRTKLTKPLKSRLEHGVVGSSGDYQAAMNVLDMEIGDEMGMWVMEKAAYIGLTHPHMTRNEMILKVAEACMDVWENTKYDDLWLGGGYVLGDLKDLNFGFREDGSAFIFDFNIGVCPKGQESLIEDFIKKIRWTNEPLDPNAREVGDWMMSAYIDRRGRDYDGPR
jgi:hypothetical protein